MPYIVINASTPKPSDSDAAALLSAVSRVASEALGKPERVMMTRLEAGEAMTFAGSGDPCAMVDVRGIGLPSADQTTALCQGLSQLVSEHLGLDAGRVFFNYTDMPRELWGVGGKLLA